MLDENEKEFKKTQRDFYSKEAVSFDVKKRRENRNHFNKIKAISDFLGIVDGDHVLEVGTGTGIHATFLLKRNVGDFSLTCSDLSFPMLAEARKKVEVLRNVHFVVLEGERLPFPDECFDKVFLSGALHHFFDPTQGINEILRVLKKRGRFCIMEPNYIFPTNFIGTWTHLEERGLRNMTKGNLSGWLDAHGVNSEIVNFSYTPPFPLWMHLCWDFLDSILNQIPYLREVSVMLFARGTKK
jgi:ubiquinone/menaquinone biosynthesis C-methylase UbiE